MRCCYLRKNMFLWLFECSDTLKREICQVEKVFRYRSDIVRVVHGIYLSVPSHGTFPIGMTFPWTSLGLSMGHTYLSHPIAIYACPIPWDVSHRNDIPMDKPGYCPRRFGKYQMCFLLLPFHTSVIFHF